MRKQLFSLKVLATLTSIAIFTSACFKDNLTKTYSIMYPVYESKSVVYASINGSGPQAIKAPGKLFIYGSYIFLNEIDKGVHVIDNSNPSNPKNVSFIKIPGNLDIAVKGNMLYADLYTDMLAIDISQPSNVKITKTISDIFPERQYLNGFNPDTTKVIVGWLKKDTTVKVERSFPGLLWGCINCAFALDGGAKSSASNVPGVAGSMSRFAVVNDYLYAVNSSSLETVSIINPQQPEKVSTKNMGWGIETIYPFKNKLFLGSNTGLFTLNINNPAEPQFEGSFSHARACDPVVADDNYAFVTLRAGTACQGTANQLDVLDVSNIASPKLLKTYQMVNPFGLSKDGNTLFVCDGKDGLKIYDASSVLNLKLQHHLKGMETYDAIAYNKNLILVTKEGLRQYDYSNLSNLKLLSNLSIVRE